jgi:hypothetical protein
LLPTTVPPWLAPENTRKPDRSKEKSRNCNSIATRLRIS